MNILKLLLNIPSEDNCLCDNGKLFHKQAALYFKNRLLGSVLVVTVWYAA